MKKTLVAVAALAAVTGAMAEVAITGNIDQAITSIKGTTAGTQTSETTGLMSVWTPSWITFAGSEDLGSGMKASFKFENGLGINGGNLLSSNAATTDAGQVGWNRVSSGNREAWVGVAGDFGNIQLGTQYTPVFLTSAGTDVNAVNNVAGWLPFNVIFSNSAGYNANAITYTSPSLSGFTLQVQQTYGATDTIADGASASAGDGAGWSVNYAIDHLTVGYAQHQKATDGTALLAGPTAGDSYATGTGGAVTGASGDLAKVNVLALTYDMSVAKLTYLNTTASLSTDSIKMDTFAVTVPFGQLTAGYSYSSGKTSSTTDTSYTGQQLGLYYTLGTSKRTTAYFTYNVAKDTTNDDSITSTALGIRHSF